MQIFQAIQIFCQTATPLQTPTHQDLSNETKPVHIRLVVWEELRFQCFLATLFYLYRDFALCKSNPKLCVAALISITITVESGEH